MKFFVDFEAMQHSDYIISIGCVNETGASFSSLVRLPQGKKINEFITKLTGITNEMLAQAPTADQAFSAFFDYVVANSDGTLPEYYCYGNNDVGFVRRTMGKMTDVKALVFAEYMASTMRDYSKDVKGFFKSPDNISLRKLYNLIQQEENEQHHDALEDAQMLSAVVANLHNCTPADKVIIDAMPKQEKPWPAEKKAPDMFINWPGNLWEADTKADVDNWSICAINANNETKYFDSMDTAVLWAIRYITRGLSPKKESHLAEVRKRLTYCINFGAKYYGFNWIKKGE